MTTEIACTKSELDVFRPVDVQVAMTDGRWHAYLPLNPLKDSNVIEFNVPGSSNDVIDMNNISIYIRAKLTKEDGAAHAAAVLSYPVNNLLGSLFRDVDVSVNSQLITRTSREYAYKDYLQKLLFWDTRPGTDGRFQQCGSGWRMDTAGKMELAANPAAVLRFEITKAGKVFELQGRPAVDLFDTDRALHPGTDLHLKFYVNDPKFFMVEIPVANAQVNVHKLEIMAAELCVRRVTVGDVFVNEINKQLSVNQDAIYPFVRREFSVSSIPAGDTVCNRENLFSGKLASRYTIVFVSADGYTGAYKKNPFKFQHADITEIGIYENGQPIGGRPYKTKFEKDDPRTLQCYQQYLEIVGGVGDRAITPALDNEHFLDESTAFVFSRAPDLVHGENHLTQLTANLTLKVTMSKATTESLMMICMAEYDSVLRVTSTRNVITDYPV